MAAPAKHRRLGDFNRVVAGELVLPIPMYFIGGNHEPWGWLEQHAETGFQLCPNLHFLSRTGVSIIGPLRVAHLSGIQRLEAFDNFTRPHHSQIVQKSNKDYIGFTSMDIASLLGVATDEEDFSLLERSLRLAFAALAMPQSNVDAERCVDLDGLVRLAQLLRPEAAADADVAEQLGQRLFSKMSGCRSGDAMRGVSEQQFLECLCREVKGWPAQRLTSLRKTLSRGLAESPSLVDVLMTHDWPAGIVSDIPASACIRPVGNQPCRELAEQLRPSLMICGHMHVPYRATICDGATTVRCVGKVPSRCALAAFEAVLLDGRVVVRELPGSAAEVHDSRLQLEENSDQGDD